MHQDLIKKTLAWISVAVIVLGAVYGLSLLATRTATKGLGELTLSSPVTAEEWIKGNNKDAKVTLVEYSDFQCPTCATFAPLVQSLAGLYPEELRIVYRHYPLPAHKNAPLAALSAEAAGKQGKFWEMHDKLFTSQSDWSGSDNSAVQFRKYVEELGLNLEQYDQDIKSEEVRKAVETDSESAIRSRVAGTPTFFLNGKSIALPRSLKEFQKLVDKALKEGEKPTQSEATQSQSGKEEVNPTPQPEGKQDER